MKTAAANAGSSGASTAAAAPAIGAVATSSAGGAGTVLLEAGSSEDADKIIDEISAFGQEHHILWGSHIPQRQRLAQHRIERPHYVLPLSQASAQLFKVLTMLSTCAYNSYMKAKRSKKSNKKYFDERFLPISLAVTDKPTSQQNPQSAASSVANEPDKTEQTFSTAPSNGTVPKPNISRDVVDEKPLLSISIAEGRYTVQTPQQEQINSSVNDLHINPTLEEALSYERRLTARNILRWIYQILGVVHGCHAAYICFNDFQLCDVRLIPDMGVIFDMLTCRKLAEAVKQRQRELW
jgi:hypothetical protein